MPVTTSYPGVYIEEVPSGVRTIAGVSTSVAAFVGRALRGPVDEPVVLGSLDDFERWFGGLWIDSLLGYAVRGFFLNGGSEAIVVRVKDGGTPGTATIKHGDLELEAGSPGVWGDKLRLRIEHLPDDATLYVLRLRDTGTGFEERFIVSTDPTSPRLLDKLLKRSALVRLTKMPSGLPGAHADVVPPVDPFRDDPSLPANRFVQATGGANGAEPGETELTAGVEALRKLEGQIFNLLNVPPVSLDTPALDGTLTVALALCVEKRALLLLDAPAAWKSVTDAETGMRNFPLSGDDAKNAAIYFPWLRVPDPLQDGRLLAFPPAGTIAGVMARTDTQRGVWKAPAGQDASLNGVPELTVPLTNLENGRLNPLGLNCLRAFPVIGRVVWGARTLRGADRLASEWKYVPVRRLALFLEESLYQGTQWVVFEPNDEPLWAQIRLNVGAFLQGLFRQGAFQGRSPREAYFVKCDKDTTTQADINLGIVNIVVGFAPLKPAEFVILRIQQMAGQIET